jgi:hypothetical protein
LKDKLQDRHKGKDVSAINLKRLNEDNREEEA